MKSIVVLSGKGGVGKSSITASLAVSFSKNKSLVCADCDVDASNLSLLFGIDSSKYLEWIKLSTNERAVIDKSKCKQCNKCVDICYFNAIKIDNGFPEVSKYGCEGCSACQLICPHDAITLEKIDNAKIGYAKTKYDFLIASAQLEPGNSGSGKVVNAVKQKAKQLNKNADFLLIDSAAGVGCPVISSVAGSDFALLVTEPTPSGFSDLKKAIEIVNHFKTKKGLVINKYDINDKITDEIINFAQSKNIPVLKKISFDKNFAIAMTNMVPLIDYDKSYEEIFDTLKDKIINLVNF